MRTVFFVVTMIICAAADTVQRGAFSKNARHLSQMEPEHLIDIPNRVRRNASDALNVSEIPESDKNTGRNLMQDILSHIPNKDIIEYLISGRTKRSYIDYDTSEDQENINPKKQLEEMSSRNFPSNAYSEEEKRKLFFSQLFSMINGSSPEKYNINVENDDSIKSNNSFKADIEERFSERPSNKDKKSNSNDIDLKKNVYVPVRKTKKRRQAQNSTSYPNNLKAEENINARHERQLGELINDDNADTQFYKFNKYTPRSTEDYESVEMPMEQQLPYVPTGDYAIETSSGNIVPVTTAISINDDLVEEVHYNSNLTNLKTPTLGSQSNIPYAISDNIDVTEQDERIPTFSTFKLSKGLATKVASFENNVTEMSSTTKIIYTPNVDKSNEDIVEKECTPFYTEGNIPTEITITNSPIEKTNDGNQTIRPYAKGAGVKKLNNFVKMQSRRTNGNVENQNVKLEEVKNVSNIEQGEARPMLDVKVASVYGGTDVKSNQTNVLVNPLSARIKLDFLIQLRALGNDE